MNQLWNHRNRIISYVIIAALKISIPVFSQEKSPSLTEQLQREVKNQIPVNSQTKAQKLQQRYWNKGYLDFTIDSVSKVKNKIHYTKGQKYYWGQVSFTKDTVYQDIPSGKITTSNYNHFNLKLKDSYINNGFPFVKIGSEANFVENKINIHYTIARGDFYSFDTTKIVDTNIVSINYIDNLTQIKPNQAFSQKKVEELRSTINSSGIYNYKKHQLKYNTNKAILILDVEEQKNNTFSGFVGLQPNSENEANITGQISLDLTNTLKRGEHIMVNWKKNAPKSQLLDADFTLPFILNSPIGIIGSTLIDQQDSTFTNTKLQGGLSFYLSKFAFSSAEIRYINSTLTDNYLDITESTKSILLGLTYKKKQLNRTFNTDKGFSINVNTFAGNRTIHQTSNAITSLRVDYKLLLELYIPIGKNTVFLRNFTSGISSDSLNTNEYLRIGGIKSLRGFDENSIFAKQFNVFTVEYRYLLDDYSNIFILCDYGISRENNDKSIGFVNRMGLGAGLSLNTKAGLLSIIYAVGKTKSNPFTLNQSKIHIGYLARF